MPGTQGRVTASRSHRQSRIRYPTSVSSIKPPVQKVLLKTPATVRCPTSNHSSSGATAGAGDRKIVSKRQMSSVSPLTTASLQPSRPCLSFACLTQWHHNDGEASQGCAGEGARDDKHDVADRGCRCQAHHQGTHIGHQQQTASSKPAQGSCRVSSLKKGGPKTEVVLSLDPRYWERVPHPTSLLASPYHPTCQTGIRRPRPPPSHQQRRR